MEVDLGESAVGIFGAWIKTDWTGLMQHKKERDDRSRKGSGVLGHAIREWLSGCQISDARIGFTEHAWR